MDGSIQNINDLAMTQATLPSVISRPMSNTAIDKASKDFEGMFAAQMLQPMFESVEVDPVFGGGHGEEVMRSFLVQEYGKALAASGALNLSPAIKDAMIRAQQSAHNGEQYAANQ